MPNEMEIKVKTLKKALDVLNCFTTKQPLGVTEISEMLGLYKSNVYNILATFTAMGYLAKDEISDKYYLGEKIVLLNRAVGDRYNLRSVARSRMEAIANEAREKVFLTIPIDRNAYYLDVVFPANFGHRMSSILRYTEPLHCTSAGKAILAFSTEQFVDEYLRQPLVSATEYTITDPEELRRELEIIRERGYATDNREAEIGISCVGAPILSSNRTVLGAVSISGVCTSFTEENVSRFAGILKKNIRDMEKYL